MTISELKREGKASLTGNWGVAIGVYVVAVLINSVLSYTGVGALFTGLVTFGLCSAFLGLIRTKKMQFESLFDFTKNFGNVFLAGLLQTLFIWLWSLLFVIPGIVKTYSYAMTQYILIDRPELSGNDAITESRKMMDGHKMDLFLLDLSFIGWYILSIFTFGILLLYVAPYHEAARAQFYADLTGPVVTEAAEEAVA
jgi:uncharacterized membrane protein